MSGDNQFFNFHMEESCSNNSKIGFQSLNSDVAALKKPLSVCRSWAEKGALKHGDTIVIYARYTETSAAEELEMDEIQFADGTTREVPADTAPEAVAEAEVDEDNIPF